MKKKLSTASPLVKGTLILTLSGIASRSLGFFYRIFLSKNIGSEGMGIYQLITPVISIISALCIAGIQISISKYTAEYSTKKDSLHQKSLLISGISLSFLLSASLSAIVYAFADGISTYFLQDPRCVVPLKIVALSIPLSSLHCCVNGYCLGLSRVKFPAFLQFGEQFIRLSFIFVLSHIATLKGYSLNITMCCLGLLVGEFFSAAICFIFLIKEKILPFKLNGQSLCNEGKKLIQMGMPLSVSRVVLHFFQSLETVLLPAMLKLNGYSAKEALSVLGVISGMAMPFILFPNTIAASYSTMLLPKISRQQALDEQTSISRSICNSLEFSITFGIYCLFVFFLYGADIAVILFDTTYVGTCIKMLAFLCPFLYIDITLSSTLNGLGKTKLTFINNLISLIIRLLFVVLGVKSFGIQSYLFGILVSELFLAIISYIEVKILTHFSINLSKNIITGTLLAFAAFGISFFVITLTNASSHLGNFPALCIGILIASIIYWWVKLKIIVQVD